MIKKIRDNMFYIGIIFLSLTLFTEHLFLGETNLIHFFKGFASGIILLGVIIIFKNRNFNEKRLY